MIRSTVDRLSFFKELKEEFQRTLDRNLDLDVEMEETSEHEFFKVKASEKILKDHAEKIGYKLRLSQEADAGEFS